MYPPAKTGLALLFVLVAATPGISGETETTYGVGVIVGYDTNPLRVMADGPTAPDGSYTQLRLSGMGTLDLERASLRILEQISPRNLPARELEAAALGPGS